MTALKKYARLEAIGLWQEAKHGEPREVIVSFGAASLVLSDTSGRPLTHWELTSITTDSTNDRVAFAPSGSDGEFVIVDDPIMIDAVHEVQKQFLKTRPKRKTGRKWIALLASAAVLGSVFSLGPDLIRTYALNVMGPAKTSEIFDALAAKLVTDPCTNPEGIQAAAALTRTIDADRVVITRDKINGLLYLQGTGTLVGQEQLAVLSDPSELAAQILLSQSKGLDYLKNSLDGMPVMGVIRLIAGRPLLPEHLKEIATQLNDVEMQPNITASQLEQAFEKGVTPQDVSNVVSKLNLKSDEQLDAVGDNTVHKKSPILSDGAWLVLKSVCSTS